MRGLTFTTATMDDSEELAAIRNGVRDDFSQRFGISGPNTTARGTLSDMRHGQVLIARYKRAIVGSVVLIKKKPWAIDVSYFTPAAKPVYVISMNTLPAMQHKGIGSRLMKYVIATAKAGGYDAVRLDAFDAAHGAGAFYLKCSFAPRGRATYRGSPLLYFEWLLQGSGASNDL
jgi:GNAT superfamily N-acetyltransferase